LSQGRTLTRSLRARQVASEWLFKTRNHRAQDLRLRIRIERDAFARVTPYWRALGFPFHQLVPSYATAIGSSADWPLALAELMGIIVNDGQRRPVTFTSSLPLAVLKLLAPTLNPAIRREKEVACYSTSPKRSETPRAAHWNFMCPN
jgi:membrane peptidoglycan carboxypeptidase